MNKKFFIILFAALLIVAVFGLSACRSGGKDEPAPTPAPTAEPVAAEVTEEPEVTPEPEEEWVSDFTPLEAEEVYVIDLEEIYANMPTPEPNADGSPAEPTPTPVLDEIGG